MKKALLLNGYERVKGVGEGRLNSSLIAITKDILEEKGYEVVVTVVEDGYDILKEHQKLLAADVVFIQIPVYWFGVPAIFKAYIDKVLMIGNADHSTSKGDGRTREDPSKQYGSGGLLTKKKYMVCSTWNAPANAFDNKDGFFEGLSVDQVLNQIHKTYQFLGIQKLPSFTFFDIFKSTEGVAKQIEEFKDHIKRSF